VVEPANPSTWETPISTSASASILVGNFGPSLLAV